MSHETAWEQLPDLLHGAGGTALRRHLRSCHLCQRQLFLLQRIDSMLREASDVGGRELRGRRQRAARRGTVVLAALVAAVLALLAPRQQVASTFMLRTASGAVVARAELVDAGSTDQALAFVAEGLPAPRGNAYVLWTRPAGGENRVPVGRFMASPSRACHARFVLPGGHTWKRFWITPAAQPWSVVATT